MHANRLAIHAAAAPCTHFVHAQGVIVHATGVPSTRVVHAAGLGGWAAAGETDFLDARPRAGRVAWRPRHASALRVRLHRDADLAPLVGLGERQMRQIIAEAGLRPAALPVPTAARLDR